MTFSLAVVLISALSAVALGLVVYNLLGRLHLLENAVQGGMQPPSRRLSREEFERQFRVAQARAELATRFDTGLVVFTDDATNTARSIVASLVHLHRYDLVHVVACNTAVTEQFHANSVPYISLAELNPVDPSHVLTDLGVTTLPFCFVIDHATVRAGSHLGNTQAFTALLSEHT